jgi:hypothetical protein
MRSKKNKKKIYSMRRSAAFIAANLSLQVGFRYNATIKNALVLAAFPPSPIFPSFVHSFIHAFTRHPHIATNRIAHGYLRLQVGIGRSWLPTVYSRSTVH